MVPGVVTARTADLEKVLLEGIDSYVVFEDDAGFVPDFVENLEAYVRELPEDWGLAYLGGQHLLRCQAPAQEERSSLRPTTSIVRMHSWCVVAQR